MYIYINLPLKNVQKSLKTGLANFWKCTHICTFTMIFFSTCDEIRLHDNYFFLCVLLNCFLHQIYPFHSICFFFSHKLGYGMFPLSLWFRSCAFSLFKQPFSLSLPPPPPPPPFLYLLQSLLVIIGRDIWKTRFHLRSDERFGIQDTSHVANAICLFNSIDVKT